MATCGIESARPASLIRATTHPGYAQTRVIAPLALRLGLAGHSCSLTPPKGRAERMGVSPRPRRHVYRHANRHTWHPVPKHRAAVHLGRARRVCPCGAHGPGSLDCQGRTGRPRKQVLRPAFRTRMDFAACCMSPGIVAFVDTPPGSYGLPPGHALGPSARRAGVSSPWSRGSRTFHP